METRYYSKSKGPNGEYKLALHASKKVFDRITGHLSRQSNIKENLEKEAAHRKYLREAGRTMTSEWENSVENLRKKKEERRQQRLAQKADDRVEQYFKVLKSQEEERKKYNEKMKRNIFCMRGAQKDINSGILLSNCLYVNEKQIEHKNSQKMLENNDLENYENELIKENEKLMHEELIKQCKKRAEAEEHARFLKKQITENDNIEKEEKKCNIEKEKLYIARQNEEMALIKKKAGDNFLKTKHCALELLRQSREESKKRQQLDEKQDAELEIVCNIYRDTKNRIKCLREKMNKQDIQKRLDSQQIAFTTLQEIQNRILDDEEERIKNAITEKDQLETLKSKSIEEHLQDLKEARKKNYEDSLEETRRKQNICDEERKWQTLNRMKISEIEIEMRKQKEEKKVIDSEMFKKILDEQVAENVQLRSQKKLEEDSFIWNDFLEKDKRFFEYGAEMISQQKADGKPTFPIEQAIREYKKKHCLLKEDDLARRKIEEIAKSEVKNPNKTHRVCHLNNNSTGVRECFCAD